VVVAPGSSGRHPSLNPRPKRRFRIFKKPRSRGFLIYRDSRGSGPNPWNRSPEAIEWVYPENIFELELRDVVCPGGISGLSWVGEFIRIRECLKLFSFCIGAPTRSPPEF
jgi:hypothetical protein